MRQRKVCAIRRPAGRVNRQISEPIVVRVSRERKRRENTCPARFFSSRGLPAPSSFRRIRLKLNAPTCTKSMPIGCLFSSPRSANSPSTQANTSRCVSMSINRLVREMVEWSGTLSSSAIRTKERIYKLSLARHAIPRSESMPSK